MIQNMLYDPVINIATFIRTVHISVLSIRARREECAEISYRDVERICPIYKHIQEQI
jgi:hypothetical protein